MLSKMDKSERQLLMKRYLLGEVSEEERSELEERYAVDTDLFAELVALENDLLDSCARGSLSEAEEEKLRQWSAVTSRRQHQLDFAETLAAYTSEDTPARQREGKERSAPEVTAFLRSPAPWWAVAATICLVVVTSLSWMVVASRRLHDELERVRQEETNLGRQQQVLQEQISLLNARLQEDLQVEMAQETGSPSIASLTLTPGLIRGNGRPPLLPLPARVSSVLLRLRLQGDESPSYSVLLKTADGSQLWEKHGIASSPASNGKRVLNLKLPASLFKTGHYVLKLSGVTNGGEIEDLGGYAFRVTRR